MPTLRATAGTQRKTKSFPAEVEENLRKLRFQNYNPRTEQLKTYCEDVQDADTTLNEIIDKNDQMIRATNVKFIDPALDIDNIVPKKANSDMKRALNAKLLCLQRRTKRAILDIARKKQIEEGDLTGAGAPTTATEPHLSSDEE